MRALLLIDIQNDFLPRGALAVREGDEVIAVANYLMAKKGQYFDFVVATQDWHPPHHESFVETRPNRRVGEFIELDGLRQIIWPTHCVQATHGAELAQTLRSSYIDKIIYKGTSERVDSYSGFFDNARRNQTELDDWLRRHGIDDLVIMGLATDYCVKFTVLDALDLGYRVSVIEDGCRAVNLQENDGVAAIAEMKKMGARVLHSSNLCI